jgi:hypothetical protein
MSAKPVGVTLAEVHTRGARGLLVGGAVLLWVLGLLWALHSKGIISTSRSDTASLASASESNDEKPQAATPRTPGEEPVTELMVPPASESEHILRFPGGKADVSATPTEPTVEPAIPTYPVWFESERNIGVCRITWEGGSKTANLHVSTRLPQGKIEFSYTCGKHHGRSSIEVKPKRVNGVLFCQDGADVKVQTVRSKDGRCAR